MLWTRAQLRSGPGCGLRRLFAEEPVGQIGAGDGAVGTNPAKAGSHQIPEGYHHDECAPEETLLRLVFLPRAGAGNPAPEHAQIEQCNEAIYLDACHPIFVVVGHGSLRVVGGTDSTRSTVLYIIYHNFNIVNCNTYEYARKEPKKAILYHYGY